MDFNIIQITKINSEDFSFIDKTNLTFPIAPLASAFIYQNNGVDTLKICATLYINSKDSQSPLVGTITEHVDTVEIYFDYDWDESTPETYDVWYVEVDYSSDTIANVSRVISYLRDIDPETSRGTETTVKYP
ncbi:MULTISPECIES: hypothetical protein [Flavobacterium]|uniref:Uncharacterized protein n=1 Tax=Flavobacterium endoglycinae TaxID=2816357 RepID=A0ABX7QII1_9FLAO|nr:MULTISPECIES: hypothetical protein [Flavobacterium]QSW90874.1 hypothetical protein J0383_08695 [Flavobacterium endoglycinae]